MMNGERIPNTLMRRLERWARDNPHEYLTTDDASAKFGCTPDQFKDAVRNLRRVGRGCMESVTIWRPIESETWGQNGSA